MIDPDNDNGPLIPEGAVVMYEAHIAVYLDPESQEVMTDFDLSGTATLRDWLGTLADLQQRLWHQAHMESTETGGE